MIKKNYNYLINDTVIKQQTMGNFNCSENVSCELINSQSVSRFVSIHSDYSKPGSLQFSFRDEQPQLTMNPNVLNRYFETEVFSLAKFRDYISCDPRHTGSEFVKRYTAIIICLSKKLHPDLIPRVLSFFTITKYSFQSLKHKHELEYPICKLSNLCYSPISILDQIASEILKKMRDGSDIKNFCKNNSGEFDPTLHFVIHLMKRATPEFLEKLEKTDAVCLKQHKYRMEKRKEFMAKVDEAHQHPEVQKVGMEIVEKTQKYESDFDLIHSLTIPDTEKRQQIKSLENEYRTFLCSRVPICERLTIEMNKEIHEDINISVHSFCDDSEKYRWWKGGEEEPPISLAEVCHFVKDRFIPDYTISHTYNPDSIWEDQNLWTENTHVLNNPIVQNVLRIHRDEQLDKIEKYKKSV